MRRLNISVASDCSDAEFADLLRSATERYLSAIDAWENGYQKYYRLPSPGRVSSDLEGEHREYLAALSELQKYMARARRLCLRHSLRDPWPAMLHIDLGSRVPQKGFAPTIGRAERALIAKCLDDLESACRAVDRPDLSGESEIPQEIPSGRRNIFQRIADYFL
jgi:hypothetical protein